MPTVAAIADPEVQLMLRVQQDETGAFAALVAAYWSRVFGKFIRQVGDRQEAEDLAQDVFLRLYRSRKRYRPRAKLATWIFFIARNVGRNALRRRRRKKLTPVGLVFDGENSSSLGVLTDDSAAPATPIERDELATAEPRPGEHDDLTREAHRLANAESVRTAALEGFALLYESDRSAQGLLEKAARKLAQVKAS